MVIVVVDEKRKRVDPLIMTARILKVASKFDSFLFSFLVIQLGVMSVIPFVFLIRHELTLHPVPFFFSTGSERNCADASKSSLTNARW